MTEEQKKAFEEWCKLPDNYFAIKDLLKECWQAAISQPIEVLVPSIKNILPKPTTTELPLNVEIFMHKFYSDFIDAIRRLNPNAQIKEEGE